MSLRSSGGRCHKSHATSPPAETHSSVAPSGSQVSRANRAARYEAVRALHQQAISAREIARRRHMSRQTVQKFLVAESFPERSTPPYRGSILAPYKPYILDRRISWLLEWLPALYGSQSTWLHRLRGLVSPLHARAYASTIRQQEPQYSSNFLPMVRKSVDPSMLLPNRASNAACLQHEPLGFM